MHNQMHLKKAIQTPKSREIIKNKTVLAPVIDFKKNKKENDDENKFSFGGKVREKSNHKFRFYLGINIYSVYQSVCLSVSNKSQKRWTDQTQIFVKTYISPETFFILKDDKT